MAIKLIDLERFESLDLNDSSIIRGGSRYLTIPPPSLVEPIPRIKPTPLPPSPEPVIPIPLPRPPEPY